MAREATIIAGALNSGIASIAFEPGSLEAEVVQNVRTILATRRGSVPLDRTFGVSWEMLDKPLPVAKAELLAEVIEAITRWEPRAKVLGVEFDGESGEATGLLLEGQLRPRVKISIQEATA